MKKIRYISAVLSALMLLSCVALAAAPDSEIQAAAAYLSERGVMTGDERGDMMLSDGLTRAQLAVLIARLHGGAGLDAGLYSWACYFTDAPEWARPYIGYCVAMLLMNGCGGAVFAPDEPVSHAMACTAVLRCCGHADSEGTAWDYSTACEYASNLGLLSAEPGGGVPISRGETAVLVCRALKEPKAGAVITQPSWSAENYSAQADPSVFTGIYTRELYNAIRQTILRPESGSPAYTMVSPDELGRVEKLMGRMDGVLRYERFVPDNLSNYYEYPDYFAVFASMPENYEAAYEFIQPAVEAVRTESDRDKVIYLNDYLCTLLTYDESSVAGIPDTFSEHGRELPASCGSYARAFSFLCSAADIPCITISSEDHAWNLVFVEGSWLHVDTAGNDVSSDKHNLLLSESMPGCADSEPDMTAFLKELLVPGTPRKG